MGRTTFIGGASPLGLPDTLSRAPLRRRAPFAWLAAARSHDGEDDFHPRGFAPRTPRHALSRAASSARSVRVARCRSLARWGGRLSCGGLRPSHSPTRSLARPFVGALRSRGSLPPARTVGGAAFTRGGAPLGLPDTLSRAPLRRRAAFAWLAAARSHDGEDDFHPRGFAPRTPRHALSRAASSARSVRVARCRSLPRWGGRLSSQALRPSDSPTR